MIFRSGDPIRVLSLSSSCSCLLPVFVWVFLFAAATSVDAAPATDRVQKTQMKGPRTEKKDPIHVNSDRMEAYNKKNMVVFIGNVLAVQGSMQIQSDRLEVYMKKKGAQGKKGGQAPGSNGSSTPGTDQGSIERMIAIGNVLINQGKKKFASANHLDYRESTGIAVLTGNPRAWENNNQVVGTKIELYLREGRTIVYGSRRRRVSVTLFPENSNPPSGSSKSGRYGK